MVSNRDKKAKQKADYKEDEPHWNEDSCYGCRLCECVKCGGHIASKDNGNTWYCVSCGHNLVEDKDEN